MLQLIHQAQQNLSNTAIISGGTSFSYQTLLIDSQQFATQLLAQKPDLAEARVAFMVMPGYDYVKVQWGIWQAGGIAVPLCISYPIASLQYVIEDTEAEIIVVSPIFEQTLRPLVQEKGLRMIVLGSEQPTEIGSLPSIDTSRRAMILYTSGTTNLPKGVVSTHANLEAQISTLVKAWEYNESDHILCILPLHHVHGIINVICCTLWAGGTVEFLPEFSAEGVFSAFKKQKINVFMAVPTIYFKLIAHWEGLPSEQQQEISAVLKSFRLMVSGSAALPVSVMEKWEQISGHRLLERYGMTEIGMALSNPYLGERLAGHVGMPLLGVGVRLVDDEQQIVEQGQPGEIQVKGATVFSEYWRREKATADSFTDDGWFRTGDIAVVEGESYKILGRNSVDIIKSGGYKISALEIEEVLRTHPEIADCGVVGIADDEWGELVAAVLVLKANNLNTNELNSWIRERLPAYKVPRRYYIASDLPRNAMGKVTKNDLKKYF